MRAVWTFIFTSASLIKRNCFIQGIVSIFLSQTYLFVRLPLYFCVNFDTRQEAFLQHDSRIQDLTTEGGLTIPYQLIKLQQRSLIGNITISCKFIVAQDVLVVYYIFSSIPPTVNTLYNAYF